MKKGFTHPLRKCSAFQIDREPLPPCRVKSRVNPCGADPAGSLAWRPLPVNLRRNFLLMTGMVRAHSYLRHDLFFALIICKVRRELDRAITGDIISMAHRLGHCAVAEGVEEESQKQYLIAHGCDRMQGYLFSRALDEDDALALLKQLGELT